MASDITVYIDPDAPGANNGTSWTDAYTSLQTAQTAKAKDIATADERYIFLCRSSGGTADTTEVSWSNTWACDSTRYILVQANVGDEAIKTGWDNLRYRISVTDGRALLVNGVGPHVIVYDGIQCERIRSAVDWANCLYVASAAAGSGLTLKNCRIKLNASTLNGIRARDSDCPVLIWSTIFEGSFNNGFYSEVGTHNIWNCIFKGNSGGSGIAAQGVATINVVNSAVFDFGNDFAGIGTLNVDHCASDDGDGTNAVAPNGGNWDKEFHDSANGNFTLLNGGNCYHGGIDDPGSGLYSTDMEGIVYISPWSIGVDEYTASILGGIFMKRIQNNMGLNL